MGGTSVHKWCAAVGAAGRDPVLSYAATLLGATLDPAKAAELARFEWGN